jgi:hypothetical protein
MYKQARNTWDIRKKSYDEINIIFDIKNEAGTCTPQGQPFHFYHFYNDLMMKLYYYLYNRNLLNKKINLYQMSQCRTGPLTYILESEIPSLKVYDYDLDYKDRKMNYTMILTGKWSQQDYPVIDVGVPLPKEIIKVWNERPTAIKNNYKKNNVPKILFIKRGKIQKKQYNKFNIDFNLTNGTERRSIINNEEIENKLINEGFVVRSEIFEEKTFREQQKLFEDIDILIAQHGASLVHLYDVKRNITVIELPPVLCQYFNKISMVKNFKYIDGTFLKKNDDYYHVEIDTDKLLDTIRHI